MKWLEHTSSDQGPGQQLGAQHTARGLTGERIALLRHPQRIRIGWVRNV
jgi:hypothetical protein